MDQLLSNLRETIIKDGLLRPLILDPSIVDRSSVAGQSDCLQLGPAGVMDQPDRRVALQDFVDHSVFGRDRRSVRPGRSQDHL